MTAYAIYALAGWPIFLAIFIHLTRKFDDITISSFIAMFVISLVPIAREAILIWLLSEFNGKVILKRYK